MRSILALKSGHVRCAFHCDGFAGVRPVKLLKMIVCGTHGLIEFLLSERGGNELFWSPWKNVSTLARAAQMLEKTHSRRIQTAKNEDSLDQPFEGYNSRRKYDYYATH